MAASTKDELEALHRLITRSYTERIQMDLDDKIPTDAATLSGAAKFLKDNEITADPRDKEDLSALQKKLKDAAEQRRIKNGRLLQAVDNDLNEAM